MLAVGLGGIESEWIGHVTHLADEHLNILECVLLRSIDFEIYIYPTLGQLVIPTSP